MRRNALDFVCMTSVHLLWNYVWEDNTSLLWNGFVISVEFVNCVIATESCQPVGSSKRRERVFPIQFYFWKYPAAGKKWSLCISRCPRSCEQQLNANLMGRRDAAGQKLHLFASTLGNRWVWRQSSSGPFFALCSKEVMEENRFLWTLEGILEVGERQDWFPAS